MWIRIHNTLHNCRLHIDTIVDNIVVEVSDEDDDGDTVGSVLRGFLALKKKDPVNRSDL